VFVVSPRKPVESQFLVHLYVAIFHLLRHFLAEFQGGGKGTQCAKLHRDYGFSVLSTGDELRKIAKQPTELGQTIHKLITSGGEYINSNDLFEQLNF
jgi:hypothetical protein